MSYQLYTCSSLSEFKNRIRFMGILCFRSFQQLPLPYSQDRIYNLTRPTSPAWCGPLPASPGSFQPCFPITPDTSLLLPFRFFDSALHPASGPLPVLFPPLLCSLPPHLHCFVNTHSALLSEKIRHPQGTLPQPLTGPVPPFDALLAPP